MPAAQTAFAILGAALALAGLATALFARDLLRSVVAYALGSLGVAALLGALGLPVLAALELTLGAGLTSVLFLAALALTQGRDDAPSPRAAVPGFALAALGAALLLLALLDAAPAAWGQPGWLGDAYWVARGLDAVLSGAGLFAAVLGVLALLPREAVA